ncbi:aromatic-ring-hydroxylating dioxygenase subunit beta [Bordetella sp. BOR01]|uniref:aromatic-ring-hydroxylating dioxygenase subunit beta n=1 Tax=Bordetella sp. BOR01 TaxID=2854779 RepID=UPI001C4819A7|nr:aromatic-ring-hydroxylating dioxygenase subunit beta [Bordetella sp. BOR01]MBV7485463.1 aromatic-ring-hydroxylating dioxygenase subunit beta [Bordetella sp. BOR01]
MNLELRLQACDLVSREAQYLDQQHWQEWLALYAADAVLWVPTWKDETELTSDPMTELSFIYLEGRAFLEERVQRVISGRAISSVPIPRTTHVVGGTLAHSDDDGATVTVDSAWSSHVYLHKDAGFVSYAGRYEHILRWDGSGYRIARKKIILTNDFLASKLDFFYI